MNYKSKQRGLTAIGMVVMLSMLAFFVLVALRLTPIYLEYFKVKTSLESLTDESGMVNNTPAQIREFLMRRLLINDVKGVAPTDVSVQRDAGKMLVGVEYEVRSPMLGNVDVVVSFSKQVEVAK